MFSLQGLSAGKIGLEEKCKLTFVGGWMFNLGDLLLMLSLF